MIISLSLLKSEFKAVEALFCTAALFANTSTLGFYSRFLNPPIQMLPINHIEINHQELGGTENADYLISQS